MMLMHGLCDAVWDAADTHIRQEVGSCECSLPWAVPQAERAPGAGVASLNIIYQITDFNFTTILVQSLAF